MLRPIAPDDPDLPDDVRILMGSLRDNAPKPRVVSRATKPAARRAIERYEEFDADLDDDLDDELDAIVGDLPVAAKAEVPVLDRWSVQAHVYSSEIAAKLSILAGLFGGSGKRAKAGATHEAKRYRVQTTERHEVQIGVAVRLAVATTEWEVDAELSVPNIAAAAQLNAKVGDAKIGIDVVGYSGPLGDMLPAPRQLDVTTLADYLSAFTTIQKRVFGPDGLAFLTPTALSYEDQSADNPG
ncbi:MAG TPA: hypothetical protein VFX51_05125 [Solirubrobacteraceae bacterium]|nr:hypothetical protein [Solirubrobacteraceae bacterium]